MRKKEALTEFMRSITSEQHKADLGSVKMDHTMFPQSIPTYFHQVWSDLGGKSGLYKKTNKRTDKWMNNRLMLHYSYSPVWGFIELHILVQARPEKRELYMHAIYCRATLWHISSLCPLVIVSYRAREKTSSLLPLFRSFMQKDCTSNRASQSKRLGEGWGGLF